MLITYSEDVGWVAEAIHMIFINARNHSIVAYALKYKGCCIYSLCISRPPVDSEGEDWRWNSWL